MDPIATLATFQAGSLLDPAVISFVENKWPGFVATRLAIRQQDLEARLRKRYAIPLVLPVPVCVLGWLYALVVPDVLWRRGVDPEGEQMRNMLLERDKALAAAQEAADEEKGLLDLPLADNVPTTGISQGGPLGCSQQDPYAWVDQQAFSLQFRGGR